MSRQLDDKYTILDFLGEGRTSKVYRVMDDKGDFYAAKIFKESQAKDFDDEKAAIDLESHQHIVKYLQF